MKFKTIILLSSKRCGSTAIQKVFQETPNVFLCHLNQKTKVVESQFWSLAANLLEKKIHLNEFKEKFYKETFINIETFSVSNLLTNQDVFILWDKILKSRGPIIFDKSPQYLDNLKALSLIFEYKSKGNDVKILSLIRDPRDAITSQFSLWGGEIINRERAWINKYNNLDKIIYKHKDIFQMKYEYLVQDPIRNFESLFKYCNLEFKNVYIKNFQGKSIGRYKYTFNKKIQDWKFSKDFVIHLKKYNYTSNIKATLIQKLLLLFSNIIRKIKFIVN